MPNATLATLRAVIDPIINNMRGVRYVDITNLKTSLRDYKPEAGEQAPTAVGLYSEYSTWEDARRDEKHTEFEEDLIKRSTMGEQAAQQGFPGLG